MIGFGPSAVQEKDADGSGVGGAVAGESEGDDAGRCWGGAELRGCGGCVAPPAGIALASSATMTIKARDTNRVLIPSPYFFLRTRGSAYAQMLAAATGP